MTPHRNRILSQNRQADEERAPLEKLAAALAAYDDGMSFIGSCGDGGCLIVRPTGMHTNGGCRCYTDRMKAQRAMARGRMLADAVRAVLAKEAGR